MRKAALPGRGLRLGLRLGLALALLAGMAAAQQTGPTTGRTTARPQSGKPALQPAPAPTLSIDAYIRDAWTTLRRSMNECTSLRDPKVRTAPVLYLPVDYQEPAEVAGLRAKCGVEIKRLPVKIEHLGQDLPVIPPGLLYLPNPYVVPGGRFNEMYGWDSYFILLGLLRDGRVDLARDMVENFFFEIEHYGGILNANRTYYLTRSQPPFLSSMIRDVWEADIRAGRRAEARAWLARGYEHAQKDHAFWMSEPQRAGDTGLARYYDFGEGPVPEMADDDTYYQNVIKWLLGHPGDHPEYLVEGPATADGVQAEKVEAISCNPAVSEVCARAHVGTHWLTKDFYKGDRAMRESGFDPSFRWGPFDGSTHHYAAVGLNALLYKYEMDLAWMAEQLGKSGEAQRWRETAQARQTAMDKYLWNAQRGMYFDYDYESGKQSTYEYLTTFYPLWAGAASPEQARRVEANLKDFEHPGGLAMSTTNSGVQWDLPYGWAPVTWLAIDGMKKQGDLKDAERVSREFMATIRDSFSCDHTIREKYNVVTGSSVFAVAAGYRQNVVGFGWTNAAYLKMQELLKDAGAQERPAPQSEKRCTAQGSQTVQ